MNLLNILLEFPRPGNVYMAYGKLWQIFSKQISLVEKQRPGNIYMVYGKLWQIFSKQISLVEKQSLVVFRLF